MCTVSALTSWSFFKHIKWSKIRWKSSWGVGHHPLSMTCSGQLRIQPYYWCMYVCNMNFLTNRKLRGFRFWQHCFSGFRSSVMSCCVIEWFLMFWRDVGNLWPSDMASCPRNLNSESGSSLKTVLPDFVVVLNIAFKTLIIYSGIYNGEFIVCTVNSVVVFYNLCKGKILWLRCL